MFRRSGFVGLVALGAAFAVQTGAGAQTSGTYYDSFYSDYQNTYPNAVIEPKYYPPAQEMGQMAPQATNAMFAARPVPSSAASAMSNSGLNGYYKPIRHVPGEAEIEVRYRMSNGQFMFETDVGSVLHWDEAESKVYEIKFSRDFNAKGRQYVFDLGYSSGSMKTERTSDDDIFNELHIISLGRGSAKLSSYSVGVGMRNWARFAGFDVTPSIGWKQKSQKFEMADHVAPAPFYFEEMCWSDEYGICADIDLNLEELSWLQGYIYMVDKNGNYISNSQIIANGWGSDIEYIPAISAFNGVINLMFGMLVPDEDFCWVTDMGRTACLREFDADDYNNVSFLFGGVSSLLDQRGYTTHKYYTTWAGPYIGLSLERAMSPKETLLIYGEFFKPKFKAKGDWPLRTDWMHDPSFIDDGGDAWGLAGEISYRYRVNEKTELTFGFSHEFIQAKHADTLLFFADDYGQYAGSEKYDSAIELVTWKDTTLFFGAVWRM